MVKMDTVAGVCCIRGVNATEGKRAIWDRCQCCSRNKCEDVGYKESEHGNLKKDRQPWRNMVLRQVDEEALKELLSRRHFSLWKDGMLQFLQHEMAGVCVWKDFFFFFLIQLVEIYFKKTLFFALKCQVWSCFQVSCVCAVKFFQM